MFFSILLQASYAKQFCVRLLLSAAISLIAGMPFSLANAADVNFDEPFEGRTRACVGNVCINSLTSFVAQSTAGSISTLDLFAGLPTNLLPFASLFDLQNYETSQTLMLDIVDSNGTVLNTIAVDFAVAQLQYTAAFQFRSDAAGLLVNGAGPDVLATGGYQDVTFFLQSQVDLSGLAYPFNALAAFFQPEFFPISVAVRSGALSESGPPALVPEPPTLLLLLAGLFICFLPRTALFSATYRA